MCGTPLHGGERHALLLKAKLVTKGYSNHSRLRDTALKREEAPVGTQEVKYQGTRAA